MSREDNVAVFEDSVRNCYKCKENGFYIVGVYDEVSLNKKGEFIKLADKYIYSFKELPEKCME